MSMNINGLALVSFKNNDTNELVGTRIKHNTNTDIGKQLILLKLNPDAVGSFAGGLPSAITTSADNIDSYRIKLFAVGSSGGAPTNTVNTQTSLNKLVPMRLKTDATADSNVYFKPNASDSGLIDSSNYSPEHTSSSHDDYYWKMIDSYSKEGANALKYVLQINNTDVVSADTSKSSIALDEFGLYAVSTSKDGSGVETINNTLPKVLFARLAESYSKSSSIGISIEWIVGIL